MAPNGGSARDHAAIPRQREHQAWTFKTNQSRVHAEGVVLWFGPWYGGVQNVWGEENVPEKAPSRKFLDPSKRASGLLWRGFLYRKNRALTPEGGGKRTVRGGVENPFWEGCQSWGFPPPSFFHPPHGVLWMIGPSKFKGEAPKVTEPNLRFLAVFCENLRCSAVSCAFQMLEFPGEGVNLRKSAVCCEDLGFGLSLSL